MKMIKKTVGVRRFCFCVLLCFYDGDLQDSFGQVAIVLLGDLRLVDGPVEDGRVVVDVLDVDDHRRVVLVQIVRRHQAQLVLNAAAAIFG